MANSAVQFKTASRIHVSLAVSSLERSSAFYQALFDALPSKTRPGYARFEVSEPAVNLSLIESSEARGPSDSISHFGVQVKSTDVVASAHRRLEAAGLVARGEDAVNCCHAIQDKVWVVDPDGYRWEVFVVLDDTPTASGERGGECCPTASSDTCCDGDVEPCCAENEL